MTLESLVPTMMTKILIAPRYARTSGIERALLSTSFSNYLLSREAFPFLAVPPTYLVCPDAATRYARHFVQEADGVILQGGNDIDPSLYGEECRGSKDVNRSRDLFEVALVHAAIEAGKPIMAVCRGMQLVNVAKGGSLHQHLAPLGDWIQHFPDQGDSLHATSEHATDCSPELHHPISLTKGGVLRNLYQASDIAVNSYHHQGIKTLGNGLNAEARTADGLIEAFSSADERILGVQWHPELCLNVAIDRESYDDFRKLQAKQSEELFDFWLEEWVRAPRMALVA